MVKFRDNKTYKVIDKKLHLYKILIIKKYKRELV